MPEDGKGGGAEGRGDLPPVIERWTRRERGIFSILEYLLETVRPRCCMDTSSTLDVCGEDLLVKG